MFTVTPMNQQIELEAGGTYTVFVTISNPIDSGRDFNYRVSVGPYNVVGEDYKADLATMSNRSEIVNWITISEPTGVLSPNDKTEVEIKINVPENAASGGQYATILIGSNDDLQDSENLTIQNVYEMGSIVYASVAGETVHSGEVIDNYVPGFAFSLPVATSATISNAGNVHETAQVSIEIRDVFSGQKVYPSSDETGAIDTVIMPETKYLATQNIDGVSPLGVYKVTQTIRYLGNTSVNDQVLIVCPAWFLLLVVLAVGTFFAIIIRKISKRRRKKFNAKNF